MSTPPIQGPNIPFHAARAYGLRPPAPPATPNQAQPAAANTPTHRVENTARLVAATVNGAVDFNDEAPQPQSNAIALYTRAGQRNAAATSINAGRAIDVTA